MQAAAVNSETKGDAKFRAYLQLLAGVINMKVCCLAAMTPRKVTFAGNLSGWPFRLAALKCEVFVYHRRISEVHF